MATIPSLWRRVLPLRWIAAGLLCVFALHAQPANDGFSRATRISGLDGTAEASNVGATAEPGEPPHAGAAAKRSVWFQWVAEGSGVLVLDTLGSGFDTRLAVYQGSGLASLTRIASSNDSLDVSDFTSQVRFAAIEGQTYWIAIDGHTPFSRDAFTGPIRLRWSCLECAAAAEAPPEPQAALAYRFRWDSDASRYYRIEGRDALGQWEDVVAAVAGTGGTVDAAYLPTKDFGAFRVAPLSDANLRPLGLVDELLISENNTASVGDRLILPSVRAQGPTVGFNDLVRATYRFNPATLRLEPTRTEVFSGYGPTVEGLTLTPVPAPIVLRAPTGLIPEDVPTQMPIPSGPINITLASAQLFGLAILQPEADLFLELRDPSDRVVLNRFVARNPGGRASTAYPALTPGNYTLRLLGIGTNTSRCTFLGQNLNKTPVGVLAHGSRITGTIQDTPNYSLRRYSVKLNQGQLCQLSGSISSALITLIADDRSQLIVYIRGLPPAFRAARTATYHITVLGGADIGTGNFNLTLSIQ